MRLHGPGSPLCTRCAWKVNGTVITIIVVHIAGQLCHVADEQHIPLQAQDHASIVTGIRSCAWPPHRVPSSY
jgi:hypothetical protein